MGRDDEINILKTTFLKFPFPIGFQVDLKSFYTKVLYMLKAKISGEDLQFLFYIHFYFNRVKCNLNNYR